MTETPFVSIIVSCFNEEVVNQLLNGAVEHLNGHSVRHECVRVPGVLEIPAALHCSVVATGWRGVHVRPMGYIVLGCVIKGETDHYEYCCSEAMRGVQDLAARHCLALGNGILTCQNRELALSRARVDDGNVGGRAARACLRMVDVKQELGF